MSCRPSGGAGAHPGASRRGAPTTGTRARRPRSRASLAWLVICGLLITLATADPAIADPAPQRFALLIGANSGDAGDQELLYAETDAAKIAEILRELGGFAAEDVQVLTNATATDVRRSLAAIGKRVEMSRGDSVLFVFYSGHGDAESLHLKGTRLTTRELRELVDSSSATVRVLVVDACRSGGFTRRKGGRPGPAFAIDFEDRLRSKGVAILSSSTDGEDSQESDRLRASFFTHYFASALRGAADDDNDGRISLAEAFGYASQRTIAATTQTAAGPQHPTYRYDLTGREDVVLTITAAQQHGVGSLRFGAAGTYLVQRRDGNGPTVAEVTVSQDARVVAVSAGDYFITRRAPDHLLQGTFSVASGASTTVEAAAMQRIAYAQVIRKGGTELGTSMGAFVTAGARGGIGNLGPGLGLEAGLRLDRAALSFELRGHFATSAPWNAAPQGVESYEAGATVAGLRVIDRGRWSAAAGLEAGTVWRVDSKAGTNPSSVAFAGLEGLVGVLGQLQRALSSRTYARLELGALGYWNADDGSSEAGVAVRFSWSVNAGLGAYF